MNRQPANGFPCPACGRFIDPAPECPYCGVDTPRHRIRITLQWVSLLLILAGFLGLLLS